jgi:glycosyltransferase involved in cell wall biosynthesis
MKVALVTSFPKAPESPRGGVEAVSVNLVKALAHQDNTEVHVITCDPAGQENEVSSWEGATIHRLPRSQQKLLNYAVTTGKKQVQDYLLNLHPEIVHAHDFYGLMTQGLNLPRVFTIHGFIHEDTRYAGGLGSWLRAQLWRWYEIRAWADQPHLIAISPYVRERLRGIYPGTIHDIENPISPEFFDIQRNEVPGCIFCAAAICKRKNTLCLLQAFEHLLKSHPDATLRWAGQGAEDSYHQQVKTFINSRNLHNKVSFLGNIQSDQIRVELSQCSVFALVSFEEGAPMGVAEAMAAGIPVVTSNRCGMPYMVRDGESGFLVNPEKPSEIASVVGRLLADKNLRLSIGNLAQHKAADLFHPFRVAKKTASLYHRIISEK